MYTERQARRDRSEFERCEEIVVALHAQQRIGRTFLLDIYRLLVDVGNGSKQITERHSSVTKLGVVRVVGDVVIRPPDGNWLFISPRVAVDATERVRADAIEKGIAIEGEWESD